MFTTPKEVLSASKTLRIFLLLWAVFLFGVVIALSFGQTKSAWRFVSLAGFLLSLASYIIAVKTLPDIQVEIRSRYANANAQEKRFLKGLFYFARSVFLILGLFFLVISSPREAVNSQDMVEIGGKITRIETIGEHNPSLKITLENNPNQYGINTYKLPELSLQRMENELRPGHFVSLYIRQEDVTAVNDPYVDLYGIRTETAVYLVPDEVNQANTKNSVLGRYLGLFLTAAGLVYMLAGNVARTRDRRKTRNHNLPGK